MSLRIYFPVKINSIYPRHNLHCIVNSTRCIYRGNWQRSIASAASLYGSSLGCRANYLRLDKSEMSTRVGLFMYFDKGEICLDSTCIFSHFNSAFYLLIDNWQTIYKLSRPQNTKVSFALQNLMPSKGSRVKPTESEWLMLLCTCFLQRRFIMFGNGSLVEGQGNKRGNLNKGRNVLFCFLIS